VGVILRHVILVRPVMHVDHRCVELVSVVDPFISFCCGHLNQILFLSIVVFGSKGETQSTRYNDIGTPSNKFSWELGQVVLVSDVCDCLVGLRLVHHIIDVRVVREDFLLIFLDLVPALHLIWIIFGHLIVAVFKIFGISFL